MLGEATAAGMVAADPFMRQGQEALLSAWRNSGIDSEDGHSGLRDALVRVMRGWQGGSG